MVSSTFRTLYVIAAGEPDASYAGMNELKRPLSRRGIANVLTLLEELKEHPIPLPELILCSPSLYVHQTLDLLHEVFGHVDVTCKDALYAAPDYRILDAVRSLDDILFSVMIVGELPGLRQFASYVSKGRHTPILKPADGIVLTLPDGESWHTLDKGKAHRRPFFHDIS